MDQFRTELFGFNKQDVSRYIQKLSRSAKEYDDQNSDRCSELETELKGLNEKIRSLSDELAFLKDELSKKNGELTRKEAEMQKYIAAYTDLCTKISNAIKDSQEAVLNDEKI